jgi:hypothetical protein
MRIFFSCMLALSASIGRGQNNFCFKQIDSIVQKIVSLPQVTIDSGNVISLNGLFSERLILDSQRHEILAILQDYTYDLHNLDTSARTFCLAMFFNRGELINVREFELNDHLRKINSHYYYYTRNGCKDTTYSDPDMTKKLYYYRLATRLRSLYAKLPW